MSSKSPVFQRFVKSHARLPRAVEDILQVAPKKSAYRSQKRPKTFLKGVGHDGNYYRLKIPPRKKKLPDIPKLPKGTPMPKPLTPPPKPPATVSQKSKAFDDSLDPGFATIFPSWYSMWEVSVRFWHLQGRMSWSYDPSLSLVKSALSPTNSNKRSFCGLASCGRPSLPWSTPTTFKRLSKNVIPLFT